MTWMYKNDLLVNYLRTIYHDESNFKYLYLTIRKILDDEYQDGMNMDNLIEDILSRDKIKNIMSGNYKKIKKTSWIYKDIPLKDYLDSICKNKEDLDYLIRTIRRILRNEYNENINMDDLIDDILSRENIKLIINGSYKKKTQNDWYYKNTKLINYIKNNIKSEYRSLKSIRQNIEDNVTKIIKDNNYDISKREELITNYINSQKFNNFLKTKSKETNEYYYENKKLYHYLKENVKNINELAYIYNTITNIIRKKIKIENKDLDIIIFEVMNSEEVKNLINSSNLIKKEYEVWPYKDGLLIDYLKTLNFSEEKLQLVYRQIREHLSKKYSNGFKSLDEKRKIVEHYLESKEFKTYLKYGYIDKKYYYDGMLLIDYLKSNYSEILEKSGKTPQNLYDKIIYMLAKYNLDDLSLEDINKIINKILNSEELENYLFKDKLNHYDWIYNGRSLKDIVNEKYKNIIDDETDLSRIYTLFMFKARKDKNKNIDKDINEILDNFFKPEFIKKFSEYYVLRKINNKEITLKNTLYNDINYIENYIKEKNINKLEVKKIMSQGFNYYSAIMLLEYASMYNEDVEELIKYTNNINLDSMNYLLWMHKLGYREYSSVIIEKNKKIIDKKIYKYSMLILGNKINEDYSVIYNYLNDLIIKKHILFTTKKEGFAYSFYKFCDSCIKRYMLEYRRKFKSLVSLDDINYYINPAKNSVEDDYISNEEKILINDIINSLTQVEKEFVYLRYGFIDYPHNLNEIEKIFNDKNIDVDVNKLDKDILKKLKKNKKVLSLKR